MNISSKFCKEEMFGRYEMNISSQKSLQLSSSFRASLHGAQLFRFGIRRMNVGFESQKTKPLQNFPICKTCCKTKELNSREKKERENPGCQNSYTCIFCFGTLWNITELVLRNTSNMQSRGGADPRPAMTKSL